jgi:hypothetical protein
VRNGFFRPFAARLAAASSLADLDDGFPMLAVSAHPSLPLRAAPEGDGGTALAQPAADQLSRMVSRPIL